MKKKYQNITLMITLVQVMISHYRHIETNRRPYQWEDGAFVSPDAAFVPDPMEPQLAK